jgi:hypothetical protein
MLLLDFDNIITSASSLAKNHPAKDGLLYLYNHWLRLGFYSEVILYRSNYFKIVIKLNLLYDFHMCA